jgi:hypothetical protein
MCALSAMTPGFADQTSAHPDEAGEPGREAGEPGGEAGAPAFGVAEAQPADKRRITAAVHHAPAVVRRVIGAPLSGPLPLTVA